MLAESIWEHSVWHSHPGDQGFPDPSWYCLALDWFCRLPPSRLHSHFDYPTSHSSKANFQYWKCFHISQNAIFFIKFNQLIAATNPKQRNWGFPDIWRCFEDFECSRSSCDRFMKLRNLDQEGANWLFQLKFDSFQVTNSQLQFLTQRTHVYEFSLNYNLSLTLKSRVPQKCWLGCNL